MKPGVDVDDYLSYSFVKGDISDKKWFRLHCYMAENLLDLIVRRRWDNAKLETKGKSQRRFKKLH